jgi:uncharacterized membrane protein YbaN (DUF454 family)
MLLKKQNMVKPILIFFGTVFLFLGIAGIFIPGLPTTPFLLLTAGLYVRSSGKLYRNLIKSKFIGSYITDFQRDKGLTLASKLYSISTMWIMILISNVLLVESLQAKLIIIGAGIIGTIVMGFIIPTVRSQE